MTKHPCEAEIQQLIEDMDSALKSLLQMRLAIDEWHGRCFLNMDFTETAQMAQENDEGEKLIQRIKFNQKVFDGYMAQVKALLDDKTFDPAKRKMLDEGIVRICRAIPKDL